MRTLLVLLAFMFGQISMADVRQPKSRLAEEICPKLLGDSISEAKAAAFELKLRKASATFMIRHLRAPTLQEIAVDTGVDAQTVSRVVGDFKRFLVDVVNGNPLIQEKIRSKLVAAFLRVIQQRSVADYQQTRPQRPTVADILAALAERPDGQYFAAEVRAGAYNTQMLNALLGDKASPSPIASLVVFPGGIKELEGEARTKNPKAFKNYLPAEIYDPKKTEATLAALNNKNGFLATSVTAGMPINQRQLKAMLAYAQERDFDILVFPTAQIMDGLDPGLMDNPRVHIVTHTIQNDFFRLWNIPILPKNMNPFASLEKNSQFIPGQVSIVGHPQLAHRNVPTSSNAIRPTEYWSTGSLSEDLYPYRSAVQGRTGVIAENNHTNGFLVLEKADAKAGAFSGGAQNQWFVRAVNFNDDSAAGGTAGFNELGRRYFVDKNGRVKSKGFGPNVIVLGDLHEEIMDQAYMQKTLNFIVANKSIDTIVVHDPVNGGSHNRHENEDLGLLIKKFMAGELDYHGELMGLVQFVNAVTEIRPDIRVVVADSNHSYWGQALVNRSLDPKSFHNVINGKFLTELQHASRILGVSDPLTYVLKYRNDYIASLPAQVRRDFEATAILVDHPDRVQVLPFGQSFVVGPDYRPVHINFHGHQGANGGRPSPNQHATGSGSSITADSHQSHLMGTWMSVGTSTPIRVGYNNGGYSSWSNSFAVVYPDGSKQLVTYSSLAQEFQQNPANGLLPPDQFFGQSPLRIIPNSNDLVGGEITDQNTMYLNAIGVPKRGQPTSKPH